MRALTPPRSTTIEGEDLALALLEFESGAVATLEATTCAWPGYPRRVEISGTEGTVTVEGDDVVAAELRTPRPDLVGSTDPHGLGGLLADARERASPTDESWRTSSARSATARPPACDGREGRRSLALVEAVYAAARAAGREVR